ncbi:hypothetical protein AX14_004157 [Amanita brunnescens Koide BX004]|nr:hypothetical protein AX14_004157 [Amanita brunnescens Koide BX004]
MYVCYRTARSFWGLKISTLKYSRPTSIASRTDISLPAGPQPDRPPLTDLSSPTHYRLSPVLISSLTCPPVQRADSSSVSLY